MSERVTLYHFTSREAEAGIVSDGVIAATSKSKWWVREDAPRVVWVTQYPGDFTRPYPDRLAVRIAVTLPASEVLTWDEFTEAFGPSQMPFDIPDNPVQPGWFLIPRSIHSDEWIGAWDMRDVERRWGQ